MWVVIGLGNPGPRYANTRHNAGFHVVDLLAHRWRIDMHLDEAARLRRGRGSIGAQVVTLLQPWAYMNRSGEVVTDVVTPDDQLVAVFDDLDLPEGALRVRAQGGAGGHRGVASLLEQLGDRFVRVRVGIGRPPAGEDPAAYVLEPLSASAAAVQADTVARAADAVECLITDGLATAMNRFNVRPPAPASASV